MMNIFNIAFAFVCVCVCVCVVCLCNDDIPVLVEGIEMYTLGPLLSYVDDEVKESEVVACFFCIWNDTR